MNILFSFGQLAHGKQVRVIKTGEVNNVVLPIGSVGMILQTISLEPFIFEVWIKEPVQIVHLPGDCLEFLT